MVDSEDKPSGKLKLLSDIFAVTFKIGISTFGGGYAMIPVMEREFVKNKKWVKPTEMIDIFAVSQSVPGVISLNTSVFVGYRVCGSPARSPQRLASACRP
ncbi:hypothetical protein FACS1894171_2650 [Clostridia bacterium]|nr:hypothetical protein FACS1894171_2650 [Clostridia bacterium]